jgi:hypothetical protein
MSKSPIENNTLTERVSLTERISMNRDVERPICLKNYGVTDRCKVFLPLCMHVICHLCYLQLEAQSVISKRPTRCPYYRKPVRAVQKNEPERDSAEAERRRQPHREPDNSVQAVRECMERARVESEREEREFWAEYQARQVRQREEELIEQEKRVREGEREEARFEGYPNPSFPVALSFTIDHLLPYSSNSGFDSGGGPNPHAGLASHPSRYTRLERDPMGNTPWTSPQFSKTTPQLPSSNDPVRVSQSQL